MYAIISREKIQLPPGTVVRLLGSWQDYQTLCQSRGDVAIPRIKYHDGEIILMSPLPKHGREASILADVVKALLDSQNRNYEAFTPITMELPEVGGIEPDYCFYIDHWRAVVGRDRLQWGTDPAPDLVLEIDVTSYTNANDYLPFQVPEIWLLKRSRLIIYGLEDNAYKQQSFSRYFPGANVQTIVSQCLAASREYGTGITLRNLRQQLSEQG
ncbi:Uma2 family endonuclease [Coleofasciculus sp. E1-EBD-02]|jgi:Uma2 family endonuclease|uniref:Uma2 family endonuclease n=1 Tax=Coleofasciculus sp. E1-EBD-02 TaxID=3068481 RepID=UPI0032FD4B0C